MIDSSSLIQDTLTDSDLILERIIYELSSAQNDILVAMAWFTNPDLLATLESCIRRNVQVSLIISDQSDNEKLDFSYLMSLGAEVIRIRNVGWGMMHQKFCVIDRKIAITGSYNWSVNAKNNHESVIVTNYSKTVDELVRTFFNIRNRAVRINNGETVEDLEKEEDARPKIEEDKKDANFQELSLMEFKRVLDNIIATEVGAFDKELLKNSGYNRAEENNGDHQVLPQAMDSLYSNFINEIEVIEDKKTRLKAKIDEQQKISASNVELKTENEIIVLKDNYVIDVRNAENGINELDKQIDETKLTIKSNNDTTVSFIEAKVAALRKQISDLGAAFVKPPSNKFLLWIFGIIGFSLLLYLIVFYSSVAYIFIFSKEDTKSLLLSGAVSTEVPEVFNAHALSKIWTKGVGGVLFSLFFIFIPITLGFYELLSAPLEREKFVQENKEITRGRIATWFIKHTGLFLILIVDVFVAYKVAININEIAYVTRQVDRRISFWDVLIDSNFWLVFLLGTLGVFLFSRVVRKLYDLYCLGSATHQEAKIKYEVDILEHGISEYLSKINAIKLENDQLSIKISNMEKEMKDCEKCLQNIPIKQNEKISRLQQQLISYKEKLSSIANIYKSQIDNDKLPISKAEMENRINIFMEGWSKYLHDVYAIRRAESKTSEAIREIESWLTGLSFQSERAKEYNN